MPCSKPIWALRIFTSVIMAILLVAAFLPKGSSVAGFLTGLAAGLSIAVQIIAWSGDLRSADDCESDPATR